MSCSLSNKNKVESIDKTDGLSMNFDNWRFSVRMSSTEALLRFNLEAKGDAQLMRSKTDELVGLWIVTGSNR